MDLTSFIVNPFYGATSSFYGHAISTSTGSPMNIYYNPAGLSSISSQSMQLDASIFLKNNEFPDSETTHSLSFNGLTFAFPLSSNYKTAIFGIGIRAPLVNTYNFKFDNGVNESSYLESYNFYEISFSAAQKFSKNISFGLTFSTYFGETKIEERNAGTFGRLRKHTIKITENPTNFLFGLLYTPFDDITFGLTFQSSSKFQLKSTRTNDDDVSNIIIKPAYTIGLNYKLTEITDLRIDFTSRKLPTNEFERSFHTGFDLDIFEDIGFGLGAVFIDNFSLKSLLFTSGLSYENDKFKILLTADYANKDKRSYYFKNVKTSKYLIQSSIIYFIY